MIDNIAQLAPYIGDEDKAREMFERIRWPNGPYCPHCHADSETGIYKIEPKPGSKTRKGVYKCGGCRKQFTVTVGTVFEGTRIPLGKWLYAIFLMCSSKKGVSANQLQREIGISYKSAWFMCHRVRMAMTEPALAGKLGGEGHVVEVDETFIGGKHKNNPHRNHKPKPKQIVVALIDREGKARTFPVPSRRKWPLQTLIRYNVLETSHIATDAFSSYEGLDRRYAGHGAVDHSKEFVRGVIHTNFAESYFSLFKRSIFGSYHHVSARHLPRYLRECEFKWNSRDKSDGERTVDAIRGSVGKRLVYKEPIKKRGRPTKKEQEKQARQAQTPLT